VRVSWWSIGYWLALVAAAVLIIVIALNRRGLEQRLGQQQQALAKAIADTREVEKRGAVAQSSILYAREASIGINRMLGDVASDLPSFCDEIEDGLNFCSRFRTEIEFSRLWSLAATLRSEAQNLDDFGEVADAFQRFEEVVNRRRGSSENSRWLARAREGVAYARYRQGRLDEAERIIRLASQLRARPAFVGLTRLKVMCAQRAEPARVQAELTEMRDYFRNEAVRLSGALERNNSEAMQRVVRDAREDAVLIERDEELFIQCAYTNITPIRARPT
jgi:hypothetical protein